MKTIVIVSILTVIFAIALVGEANAINAKEKPVNEQIFENKELNVPGADFVPDEIIVKFKDGVGEDKIDKINSKHGGSVRETSSYSKSKRIAVSKGKKVSEMVQLYKAEDAVEYAEPNYVAHALMIPNDPYYKYQWHLDDNHTNNLGGATSNPYGGTNGGGIRMEEAWNISNGSKVAVAVIDTGVAYENYPTFRPKYYLAPDLAKTCFIQGWDFVNNDAHPNDDNSHGTHVAGTIAQSTNNNLGVAGVAFGACIMPVKVLDKSGSGTYYNIAKGINYSADKGAKVISMSLGGSSPSAELKNALAYAYGKGVTIVAAAGNSGAGGSPSYPAAYDTYVIAVAATRYDETRAPYSTTGNYVDIAAPGGDTSVDQNADGYGDGILQQTFNPTTKKTNDFGYWFFQGTSMATPHVSGVAALLIAKGVSGPDNVRNVLQNTAERKGITSPNPEYGWGIVDAYAALNYTPP
ncbi:MAG: S8 family peptidase [Candidatus Methanoperedens sp.]|nr:S8 family peptidase [Candidatus Methanoperedens sp.]